MHVTSTVRHDDSLLVLLVERSFVLGEIPGISLDAGIGWLDADGAHRKSPGVLAEIPHL